jgi:ABC-2 type transport system permease protein
MPLVWASAAQSGSIQGYTRADFVLYYLAMLTLGSFITSHMMWDIAMEIKEGQFTPYLIRPMSFQQVIFFRNLAWRVMRTSISLPMFVVLYFLYRGYLENAQVHLGWQFWCSVVLGHFVSLTFVLLMSNLALFVEEATSIFEIYYIPMLFLSGQIFPLAVLPDWARSLAYAFPFYYTTGVPTEILIGQLKGPEIERALWLQLAWIVGATIVGKLCWRKGLRYYNAVGM